MRKIKTRNLLTVILAMLCAVAVAIGVGFALPKTDKYASAASGSYNTTDLKIDTDSVQAKYWYKEAANTPTGGDVLTAGVMSTGSSSATETNITFSESSSNKAGKIAYYDFQVGINVPAWQEYEVSFDIALAGSWKANKKTGIFCGLTTYFFKPDINDTDFAPLENSLVKFSNNVINNPNNANIVCKYTSTTLSPNPSASANVTLSSGDWTLRNESGAEKTYTFNLAILTSVQGIGASDLTSQITNMTATLQNTSVKRQALALTTDTTAGVKATSNKETYTGSPINFDVFYNATSVNLSAFTGTDFSGNAISVSLADINDGLFSATLAGTYVLTCALNSDAITDGITWWDDTTEPKTVTFTINQKEVAALPTLSGTHSYNGSAQDYNFANYDKNDVKITGVEVTPKDGTLKTLSSTGTNSWADGSGNYPVTVDDSNSIVKISATDAGEYKAIFGLVDPVNCKWASGVASDKKVAFTMGLTAVTVTFGSPVAAGGFAWKIGDFDAANPGYLSVDGIGNTVGGENVTVDLYWYSDTDKTTEISMYTTGVPDTTRYDVTVFDNYGAGTYYLCAKFANDASGDNVNRNYVITSNDTNVSPVRNGVAVQQLSITAGSASLDNIVWQYQAGATGVPANVTGATITYDRVGGVAVDYIVNAIDFPTYCTPTYSNATKSAAGTHTTTVRLEINQASQGNNKMPNPADGYTYAGEGTYTYINDTTCEIEFSWTIQQKEIDLSNVPFEYSTDNGATWTAYNSSIPPEASGFAQFQVQLSASALGNGINGATAGNYQNQYGPGVIDFEFDFQLDSNYKAKSGQNQSAMPYSMTTTGKQIQINWVRTTLKDSSGNDVKDANNVPYYVYELDTTNIPSSALPFIKYEYYEVNGTTYGNKINGGDIEKHLGMNQIISVTGLNANSQNPVQVYVRVILDGMTQVGGVDPYVLIASASQTEYKKITVGDNRRAVDLTAGTVTSMTYGGTVNIADAYNLTDRQLSQPMPAGSYEVKLYDAGGNDLGEVSTVDFTTVNAGQYTLVFSLLGNFDTTHVLAGSSLPFEVKPVELIAPTLKDGVNLVFSGEEQQLVGSLQNWDGEYMEFAFNSIHSAYHADTYKAIINIKAQYAGNYVFKLPEPAASTTKKPVKALVDGEANVPQLSAGNTVAALDWTISKYVIDTTQQSAWNFTKNGAALSFNGVPTTIKALTIGGEPTLVINVLYFDTQGNYLPEYELKGGNSFFVAACIDPNCADANDIEFKNQEYNPLLTTTTSPQIAYTVPKSGAAALLGDAKQFATKTLWGLPVWAWLLIGLAVLLLLIIIIAVCAKRRKTKEQREEAKARKEEERRMQQERMQAERELAMAKQQAELEKIRMQSGMAGAGMASMAVQQQPAQQTVQQPVQVAQSAPVDSSVLAEIKAELAEIKARQNMGAAAGMQYPNDPVAAAELIRLKAENEAHMRAELERARADAERARMEAELARVRAESRYAYPAQQFDGNAHGGDMEKIGALAVAIWQSMNKTAETPEVKAAEVPQISEESVSSSAMYPPDAVITTTTTVDTTQKTVRRERGEERDEKDGRSDFSDVDGFYDSIDY